jgi:cellulose synthase/poly-beta-1,6-N-acetylglucosamine synthase-like glycosyltransferase
VNPSLDVLIGATQGLALTMSIGFLTYVGFIIVPYVRHRPDPGGDRTGFAWHLMIPCRDEAAVIVETLRYVRSTFPYAHVWVIDDGSDDGTGTLVAEYAARDGGVHLITRTLPEARNGKADALNAGYRTLRTWLADQDALDEADRTILCVLDGDGRLAASGPAVCSGPTLFGDPEVGAVQVDVRMSNRDDRVVFPARGRLANALGRTLVRMQDLEFRTAISAIQLSRRHTGTVGMGGNGQFTRMSALAGIDTDGSGRPWRGSLLEDFELGVHLLTEGYRTQYTRDTYVDQEALPSLRRLLTQRTRWSQGTMQCLRYLPQVWRSPHVSTLGAAEILYYLVQPWMQLVGSLIYPVPWLLLAHRYAVEPETVKAWFEDGPGWLLFAIYGTMGIAPFIVWGPIYWRRCEPGSGLLRSIGWGLAYAVYIYTFYVTCWRAAVRIARRRNGWAKTRRNAEALRGRRLATER